MSRTRANSPVFVIQKNICSCRFRVDPDGTLLKYRLLEYLVFDTGEIHINTLYFIPLHIHGS